MAPPDAVSLPSDAPSASAAVLPPPTTAATLPAAAAAVVAAPPSLPSPPPLPARSPLAPPPLDPSTFPASAADADVVFATFFVSPGVNPDDYHSLRPDMRFARVLRLSHAHKKVHVAVLTDSATRLGGLGGEKEDDEDDDAGAKAKNDGNKISRSLSENELRERASVEVFRCSRIERARMGRNSYCNYAQMIAQIDYLER